MFCHVESVTLEFAASLALFPSYDSEHQFAGGLSLERVPFRVAAEGENVERMGALKFVEG